MNRNRYVGAGLAIALLLCQGCLFEPREAEPPSEEGSGGWIAPNSPKDVFLNLGSGLSRTTDSNYDRSLDDSYTFIPRPEDAAIPGLDFSNWTKDVELQVLRRVKGDYPISRAIQFGTGKDMIFDNENVEVGRAVYEGPYLFKLVPASGDTQTFAGKARFTIVQGSKGWALTKWEDYDVNGSYPTSGYLRGTLRASGG